MRNLKKILALVLALVMVVGMMSIATAATPGTPYTDDADITKYDESIQILTGLGIYKGDGEGNFEPTDPITRAEVAALVYRIVHDEKYVGIYADYNKFNDVDANDWFAGYVNYCANGEFIVGDGHGNFLPDNYVTGYQVLAIILRAIGYDREGEFQGAGWEVRTARKAKELDITKNIVEGTLGANASRAMVAELIYRAIAQTSTVSWTLLGSYTLNYETLAHANFGLHGDKDGTIAKEANKDDVLVYDAADFDLMINNIGATPDNIYSDIEGIETVLYDNTFYGEPISFWHYDGGVISIRYNPIASYTTAVTDGTVYTVAAPYLDPYGIAKKIPVASYCVDGVEEDTLTVVNKLGKTDVAETGNGVETDVYVADGNLFVVAKKPYIDQVSQAYTVLPSGVELPFTLLTDVFADVVYSDTYKGDIGAYNMVLFNMCDGVVDIETLHVAKYAPVTVGATYDSADFNTSYFKSGSTKYTYSSNYHAFTVVDEATGAYYFHTTDEEWIMNGKKGDDTNPESNFGLGDKANVFYDDYNNVILLGTPFSSAASGVGVVIGADTLRVSLGKYVLELDMIMTDGSKKTVKAVTAPIDEWSYYENSADMAIDDLMVDSAVLVNWTVDPTTGYYVVSLVDTEKNAVDGDIVRGDANAITNIDVDSTTTYIVETYKNDGKDIKGYTTYKGFKSVPSLTDLDIADAELTYTVDPNTGAYVIFVRNAVKGEQPATVTVPELVYVMDNVPEKNLTKDEDGNSITYWVYTVVKNGQVTTLKSTTDPEGMANAGLYEIEKDTETRNFYELFEMNDQTAVLAGKTLYYYAASNDVLYCATNMQDADPFKLTLAADVDVYAIVGTTLTEITLADLTVDMSVEYLVDKYGYVTDIFVVTGFENDIDGEDHVQ